MCSCLRLGALTLAVSPRLPRSCSLAGMRCTLCMYAGAVTVTCSLVCEDEQLHLLSSHLCEAELVATCAQALGISQVGKQLRQAKLLALGARSICVRQIACLLAEKRPASERGCVPGFNTEELRAEARSTATQLVSEYRSSPPRCRAVLLGALVSTVEVRNQPLLSSNGRSSPEG